MDRAPVLLYIETVSQGENIVMEDQSSEIPIKEKKKKGYKLSPPKIVMTGSANPGPIRPMQISVASEAKDTS